jgi:hypothetical protein
MSSESIPEFWKARTELFSLKMDIMTLIGADEAGWS